MQVFPDIYLLKVPIPDNPLAYLNAYVIDGGQELALVDTGLNVPEALESLLTQLQEHGFAPSEISTLIITHWHPDHFGLAREIKRRSGARLMAHRIEAAYLQNLLDDYYGLQDDLRQWLRENGMPRDEVELLELRPLSFFGIDHEVQADRILEGGEHISIGRFQFEVVWTPGHSPGHICLYEPTERILLSGDHVLPVITPNISMRTRFDESQLADYLSSLERLETLDVDLVLPAHENTFTDLRGRLGQIKRHHDDRLRAIAGAAGDGWLTTYEVASNIPWMDGHKTFLEMPVLHRRMAMTETLAHLHLLEAQGVVQQALRGGLASWKAMAG